MPAAPSPGSPATNDGRPSAPGLSLPPAALVATTGPVGTVDAADASNQPVPASQIPHDLYQSLLELRLPPGAAPPDLASVSALANRRRRRQRRLYQPRELLPK